MRNLKTLQSQGTYINVARNDTWVLDRTSKLVYECRLVVMKLEDTERV